MFTTCYVHKSPVVCITERYLPCISERQGPVQHQQHLQRRELHLKAANVCVRATLGWRETRPMTVTNCEACLRAPVTHFLTALLVPYQGFQDLRFPTPFLPLLYDDSVFLCVIPEGGPAIVLFYWSVCLFRVPFSRVPVLLPALFFVKALVNVCCPLFFFFDALNSSFLQDMVSFFYLSYQNKCTFTFNACAEQLVRH